MATEPLARPDPDAVVAVRALLYAAAELPIEACRELARLLVAHVALVTSDFDGDIARRRPEAERRTIVALRGLAAKLGHSPTTVEYAVEFEERRDSDDPIPSASAIVKRFGSWRSALAAAGLSVAELSRINLRRYVGKKRIYRYPDQRLIECLRACARDLGHPPSVRDYLAWRDEKLGGNGGRRHPVPDIPHYRCIQERFGGWTQALAAAGLDPSLKAQRAVFSAV